MEVPELLVGDVRNSSGGSAELPRPGQASPRHVWKWLMAKLVRARAAAER